MQPARTPFSETTPVLVQDPLGDHQRETAADGAPVDILVVRPSLAEVPSFEFALRERANRLAPFRHAYYARVRSIERGSGPDSSLRIVSDAAQGIRLAELLAQAESRKIPVDINAALCLIRQLVPAVAMLHESARDVGHGALSLERLLVTPNARLLVSEYVLGAAIEQLRYSRERYWTELGIVVPRGSGPARFDHRTDVAQIGVVALSLILGRPLKLDEFPGRVADVVASTWAVSPRGGFEPLPPGLRGWLGRALQIDGALGFHSAGEARIELDRVLGASEQLGSPASLEAFLNRLESSPPPPAPKASEPQSAQARSAPASEVSAPSRSALQEVEALLAPEREPAEADSPAPAVLLAMAEPTTVDAPTFDDGVARGEPLPWWRSWRVTGAAAAAVVMLLAGGSFAARRDTQPTAEAASSGTLSVTSEPSGVQAMIDGVLRGTTPLMLALEPGNHVLELRSATGDPRTFPITIASGVQLSHHVEMPKQQARAPEPAERREPEAPAEPLPAATTPAAESGWVSVSAPIELQIFEGSALVGLAGERIGLAPGRHELSLINESLGLRSVQNVQVVGGRTASITFVPPTGMLALNAVPWADVWIDGEKAGQTPIGNIELPVGAHDVLFRHPDLGERHLSALVTSKEPARLSVDLTKP